MKNSTTIGLLFIAQLFAQFALGQGFETPVITQQYRPTAQKDNSQGRFQNAAPLSLPFWDDFSQSRVYPDTLLWEDSYDVAISPTTAIDPMSFNTAVFNGITASGSPHSSVEFQAGDTDILTSCPIALSEYTPNDDLYLSFFYEKKGHGEIPNDNDGIRLEFMNEDSVWVSNIWQITGAQVVEIDTFFQVLISIVDMQYFSDKFRFRFVATGRQTGLFDTWLIDYVYLNNGRSGTDNRYPDRTFTKPLLSAFKNYHALPIDHFLTDPHSFLDNVGSQFTLLGTDNQVFTYKLFAEIMYINEVEDTIVLAPRQQLATAQDNTNDFNALDKVFEHRDFTAGKVVNVDDVPSTSVYGELRYELVGQLGDNISPDHGNIDFQVNDTIRNTFYLDDYYAYDDGSAERGAGVNNTGSLMAYKFGLPNGITDEISAIDIYFPKTIQETQFGKQVTLKVWSNANGLPGDELLSQDILIQKVDTLNQFYRYEFSKLVTVTDSFYVGWEQLTKERIFVGLDKNTDTREHIYFNITGDWEQNVNDIVGSLMIRPIFGELEDLGVITSVESNKFEASISIYPNPTSGMSYIQGDYDDIGIFSLNGIKLDPTIIKNGMLTEINMHGFPSGMYIIRLRKGDLMLNKKIILNQ